jgi:hypothetical protein
MSTPKEAADLIAKKRMGKAEGKDGSSSTPIRHSLRKNSAANSQENSPAQEKGSTPNKKIKPSGKNAKRTPRNHKSPPKETQEPPQEKHDGDQSKNDDDEDEATYEQENDEDEDFPSYKGRVVTYNDPSSGRPGHGLVGEYIQDEGYEVSFKYTDDLTPRDCVDYCPRYWIEQSLVAVDAANAWKTAMENAKKLDSPNSKQQQNTLLLPSKRPREQTKRFEPETLVTKTKPRKTTKKSKTSLGAGLSHLHLQSTLLMTVYSRHCLCWIFNDHFRSTLFMYIVNANF